MTLTVRRVTAGEGARLREVRLAALRDSPGAFSARADDEAAFDDSVWDERAARGATDNGGMATFLLEPGESGESPAAPAGIAIGHRPGPDPHRVELVSMWVAPSARGNGAGAQLVDAVARWASATGATALDLWVMRGNDGAKAFYERLGFTPTTEVAVADDDPCRDQLRLTRSVS